MAWELGTQPIFKTVNSVKDAESLSEDSTEEDYQQGLSKVLRYNLGFTWELISGQTMFPLQEIIINAWFNRDFNLTVGARGVSKSYLAAVFCLLYSIFYPEVKIVIVANNFRRVKDIFLQMDTFIKGRGAVLLHQCFPTDMSRQADHYYLKCANDSMIIGLPLAGENLRGTRANVLFIDEGLLISEHVQTTILQPFLTAKHNVRARLKQEALEDELIAEGLMTESERSVFSQNKMIITSSASFEFEYLYKIYQDYLNKIQKFKVGTSTHCILRISYEAVPANTYLEDSAIQEAKDALGEESSTFKREYRALFTSASDSYFNIKKLHNCTIKAGDTPTVQIKGSPAAEYILTIDPSYSASKSSDYFAMGVYLTIPEQRRIVQVHSYGEAGKDLREHFKYLTYLLKYFNIVYIVIDASGTEFIDGYNESALAKENNINLKFIQANFESDEYLLEISKAKVQFNKTDQRIVYAQQFSGPSNRRMNEYLQIGINAEKVWFGSPICQHKNIFKAASEFSAPYGITDFRGEPYSTAEFLGDQDDWIEATKEQLALIQVKATALGTLQFNIPSHLRNSDSPTRPRRDNYTCLLMAYYGSKSYYDILFTEEINEIGFTPMAF